MDKQNALALAVDYCKNRDVDVLLVAETFLDFLEGNSDEVDETV